ncbi:T6SS immunity protein Tdi1 domain-containing protein [Deinococcus altitudinis]|uniref:T6SS immunity protein Tdi1 domain-containing protein n=1 Tax=Deinococcus altitudinis TaxID=468914 RepID=UPI003891C2A8
MTHPLQAFLDCFPPDNMADERRTDGKSTVGGARSASADLLERFRGVLPESLLRLWAGPGLGWYGDGLIQLVNPLEYLDTLAGWLKRDLSDLSRVPVALTAFGKLVYYRRLGEDTEDVSVIDPHRPGGGAEVLAWSFDDSFNEVLCDPEVQEDTLDRELAGQAALRLGRLEQNEMFFYVPALMLGGDDDLQSVAKGNAPVHLDLLLQLALG